MADLKKMLMDHLVQDVFCRLGASPLHGVGVFAIRPIKKGLNPIRSRTKHREIKFTLDNGAFSLAIDPQWMGERLVVGARGPSEREILAWMDGALIGSDTVLAGLREKRILGAARSRIERADELGLAGVAGMTLFTIRADAAFVVPGRPLIIATRNESAAAQRPAEIILYVTE